MGNNLLDHFHRLSAILIKHQTIWKTPVFQIRDASHLSAYAPLLKFLSTLADHELDALQSDVTALLQHVAPSFPDALAIEELSVFPMTHTARTVCPPKFWNTDIPGRKEQQILAFSEALGDPQFSIVEWCCGKQHLGRLLAELHQQNTLGLDIDETLITQAQALADKRGVSQLVQSTCCDVLSVHAEHFLETSQHLLALHACGGLHTRMLQLGAAHRVARISFSPCCYHRFNATPHYQCLSAAGRNSGLSITQEELRLAVRETQTASQGETLKRKTLQAWRLGFDLLQRELSGTDHYLPMPSISQKIIHQGFPAFCAHMAALKDIALPPDIDFAAYLAHGEARFQDYQRMESVRMMFRRALECWLVLDKALFLEEQGYRCQIRQFCAPAISPRNLMVQAFLADAH